MRRPSQAGVVNDPSGNWRTPTCCTTFREIHSDSPLVYRVTKDGFTLYSVGDDFVDDGGRAWNLGEPLGGEDCVFRPVPKPEEGEGEEWISIASRWGGPACG